MANYNLKDNYFSGTQTPYKQASAVIIPVPFEETVSYGGGTRNGPAAILTASHYLESYDLELGYEPSKKGIHTAPAISVKKDAQKMIDTVSSQVSLIIRDKKFPVVLGGEHTISIGSVYGALKEYPDLSVLHFDAHSDCRSSYHGQRYSHACALYHIRLRTKKTVSVGIRSIGSDEVDYLKKEKVHLHYAKDIVQNNAYPTSTILKALSKNVFISFDIDALDPSIVEQTGTPEPGGLPWYPTLALLKETFAKKNVIGMDIMELAPNPAHPNADFTTATLLYKMLGYKFQ
jgi:agmatinase